MTDPTIDVAIRVAGAALPHLVDLAGRLISAGFTAAESEDVIKRDIQSRIEEYEGSRAADDAALRRKHGEVDEDDIPTREVSVYPGSVGEA